MEQKDKKKEVALSERMHPVVILPALLIVVFVLIGIAYAKMKGHY